MSADQTHPNAKLSLEEIEETSGGAGFQAGSHNPEEAQEQGLVEATIASLYSAREQKNRRRLRWLLGIGAVLAALAVFLFLLAPGEAFVLSMLAGFLVGPVALIALAIGWGVGKREKEAVAALSRADDLEAVGPLIETWWFGDRKTRRLTGDTLSRLLPRMKASDAWRLTVPQRAYLNYALQMSITQESADCLVAILKAMEQIGDSAVIPHVQRLAATGAFLPHQKRVRDAANECLPYLHAISQKERVRQTLLRPSHLPSSAAESLLRPAGAGNEPDSAQLLRPAASEQEP